jgi:Flp pilus assembly protein TadG
VFRLPPLSKSKAWRSIRAFVIGPDGTSGSALVEFAIFCPIIVFLAIPTMDLGLLIFNKMEVHYAAQAGAQYAIGKVTYDATAISTAVTNATRFSTVTPSSSQFCGCPSTTGVTFCAATCGPACTACAATVQGHYVTVTATPATPYKIFAPFRSMSSTYDLTGRATVRIR